MKIKDIFLKAIKNRSFLIAGIVAGLPMLATLILGAIHIRPNELQVPLRYSAFGITNIYREQWYYEFLFVGFVVVATFSAYVIALKLYSAKSVKFAVYFLWFIFVVLTIALIMLVAIFRVISVVQ